MTRLIPPSIENITAASISTAGMPYQAPVHAMRGGVVIDSVYLPKGFGNTVAIEHKDGTCLRYTHLDKKLVRTGRSRHTRTA